MYRQHSSPSLLWLSKFCLWVVMTAALWMCGATTTSTDFRHRMLSEHDGHPPSDSDRNNNMGHRGHPGLLTLQEAEMLYHRDHQRIYLNVGGILPAERWINVNAQVWQGEIGGEK